MSSVALAQHFGLWDVFAIRVALYQGQRAMVLLVAVIAYNAVDELF